MGNTGNHRAVSQHGETLAKRRQRMAHRANGFHELGSPPGRHQTLVRETLAASVAKKHAKRFHVLAHNVCNVSKCLRQLTEESQSPTRLHDFRGLSHIPTDETDFHPTRTRHAKAASQTMGTVSPLADAAPPPKGGLI